MDMERNGGGPLLLGKCFTTNSCQSLRMLFVTPRYIYYEFVSEESSLSIVRDVY